MKEFVEKKEVLSKVQSWRDIYANSGDKRVVAIIAGIYNSIDSMVVYPSINDEQKPCA